MNASVRLLCFCRSSVLVSVKASVKVSVKNTLKHTKTPKTHKTSHIVTDIEPDLIDVKINLKIFHEIGSKSTISRRAAKITTFYMLKDRFK